VTTTGSKTQKNVETRSSRRYKECMKYKENPMRADGLTNGPGAAEIGSDPHAETQSQGGEASFDIYRETPQKVE
jgi:hypothetical protein